MTATFSYTHNNDRNYQYYYRMCFLVHTFGTWSVKCTPYLYTLWRENEREVVEVDVVRLNGSSESNAFPRTMHHISHVRTRGSHVTPTTITITRIDTLYQYDVLRVYYLVVLRHQQTVQESCHSRP